MLRFAVGFAVVRFAASVNSAGCRLLRNGADNGGVAFTGPVTTDLLLQVYNGTGRVVFSPDMYEFFTLDGEEWQQQGGLCPFEGGDVYALPPGDLYMYPGVRVVRASFPCT